MDNGNSILVSLCATISSMTELVTEALVLDSEDREELNVRITLYTKELGKISARARSIKKITSKLAGHLQPLSFAKVRLVSKNGFQVVDAISTYRMKPTPAAIIFARFITEMTVEEQSDLNLWNSITKAANQIERGKKFSYVPLLDALGFSPKYASCAGCKNKQVTHFVPDEQLFFCNKCVSKIPKDAVISI